MVLKNQNIPIWILFETLGWKMWEIEQRKEIPAAGNNIQTRQATVSNWPLDFPQLWEEESIATKFYDVDNDLKSG